MIKYPIDKQLPNASLQRMKAILYREAKKPTKIGDLLKKLRNLKEGFKDE